MEIDKTCKENPIFGKEYLYSYANDISFYVYWEIDDRFFEISSLFGLNSLRLTNTIYSKYP